MSFLSPSYISESKFLHFSESTAAFSNYLSYKLAFDGLNKNHKWHKFHFSPAFVVIGQSKSLFWSNLFLSDLWSCVCDWMDPLLDGSRRKWLHVGSFLSPRVKRRFRRSAMPLQPQTERYRKILRSVGPYGPSEVLWSPTKSKLFLRKDAFSVVFKGLTSDCRAVSLHKGREQNAQTCSFILQSVNLSSVVSSDHPFESKHVFKSTFFNDRSSGCKALLCCRGLRN